MAFKGADKIEMVHTPALTIKSLKQATGVTDDLLERTLKEENDQYMVAGYFDDFNKYFHKLIINESERTDIKKAQNDNGHQIAMSKALKLWYKKNLSEATFRALIQIVLDLQEGSVAKKICEYLVNTKRESETEMDQNSYDSTQSGQQQAKAKDLESTITTISPCCLPPEHRGYHNEIPSEEAEYRLQKYGIRCYLTRFSPSQKCLILSVCEPEPHGETVKYTKKHFQIKHSAFTDELKEYWINETQKFPSIEALLQHYEHSRIHPALPNIGQCIDYEGYRRRHPSLPNIQIYQVDDDRHRSRRKCSLL